MVQTVVLDPPRWWTQSPDSVDELLRMTSLLPKVIAAFRNQLMATSFIAVTMKPCGATPVWHAIAARESSAAAAVQHQHDSRQLQQHCIVIHREIRPMSKRLKHRWARFKKAKNAVNGRMREHPPKSKPSPILTNHLSSPTNPC